MESLIAKQLVQWELLQKCILNAKKEPKDRRTLSYYEKRVSKFEDLFNDFQRTHKEILILKQSEGAAKYADCPYFAEDMYEDVEEFFFSNVAMLEDFRKKLSPSGSSEQLKLSTTMITSTPREINTTAIKLPKLAIDKFTGNYTKWTTFHDLFKTMIHENRGYAPVQKLQYLKLLLEGEPENLIRHLQITDENYESAWALLKERYNNKKVLVNSQLEILVNQPILSTETAHNIRQMLDTTTECLLALTNLKIDVSTWDPLIVHLIVKRLPSSTHQLWEQRASDQSELPTWKALQDFLKARFRTLEAIAVNGGSKTSKPDQRRQYAKVFHTITQSSCPVCTQSHGVRQCPKFLSCPTQRKMEIVKTKGLCINCLGFGHVLTNCPSQGKCRHCQRRHHSLLHYNNQSEARKQFTMNGQSSNPTTSRPEVNFSMVKEQADPNETTETITPMNLDSFMVNELQFKQVLLATAIIRVVSPSGREQIVRAVVDPGSQVSFISEKIKQDLKLKSEKIEAILQVVGEKYVNAPKWRTNFIIKPLKSNDYSVEVTGLVSPKVTGVMPVRTICHQNWKHLHQLELADPEYYRPGNIDVLLGADVHGKIIMSGVIESTNGSPTAQQTKLGWILTGEFNDKDQTTVRLQSFHICADLNNQLKRFWEIEEIPENTRLSEEEVKCEKLFKTTTKRLADGRYEVQLPIKTATASMHLGKSKNIAISRLLQMEKRFAKDRKLHEEYSKCINEYLELGHMEKVNSSEDDNHRMIDGVDTYTCSYLPHHAVLKETSTTTKLRVVFDASRPTASRISLNDMMFKGPVVQDELTAILMRWRKHRIAFSADVEKMYRQVRVRNEDAEYQRIVWRSDPSQPIEEYKLLTVTFGTKSAPYLATRVVKQLALEEKERYPKASNIALSDFYVDDLLSGTQSIEEAIQVQQHLLKLMNSGGFSLRKWASNCKKMLVHLPKEYCETNQACEISLDDDIRTLGTFWNPGTDMLSYTYTMSPEPAKWTKRTILSETSKLFDPLGLLAPIIIQAKLIIQALWLKGLEWDEEVSPDLKCEWLKYKENLLEIDNIKINRWAHYTSKNTTTELHGFSDASIKAYAAVVYLCGTDEQGNRHSTLIAAKSKVAPLKTVTLPRLELCAAALLAKLMRYVIDALKLETSYSAHAWTDSEIVIAWLRGHPAKWKTFIANRVSYIHDILGQNIWKYVPTKQNPADCASRGMKPAELLKHDLWWNGPIWLRQPEEQWPKAKCTVSTELEQRRVTTLHLHVDDEDLESRYSSLTKLIRVTAYCKRFVFNAQRPTSQRRNTYLKHDELERALHYWIQQIQKRHFHDEINLIQQQKTVPRQSRLAKLSPFIDEEGIMRVGGRLRYSDLPFQEKFPIILPDKCHLSTLIINKVHRETMHGGPQLMLQVLSHKYWLLNARNTIRYHIHKCLVCYRQRASTQTQLMGDLPASRVQVSRPFSHTGVDYCGPFELKTHKGRNPKRYKAYVSLFVCMVTKALHLELVTDLSAEGFIAAFRRFTSRRGMCIKLYCDCGTNFVGANRLLNKQQQQQQNQLNNEIGAILENEGVSFNFIPPSSPHFGGLWEAGVKSTKYHLKRVIGKTTLTYEEFSTILTQIEACLNSRPLSEISSDSRDPTPLTPAHFLIGGSLKTIPEASLLDVSMNRLNRWQLLQRLLQNFWKRWKSEYLNSLQQRPKWLNIQTNLKTGELILLKEDNLPPCHWALGRIIEIHPGKDGLVRVVTIRIRDKILKRPITKIYRLPIQTITDKPVDNQNQNQSIFKTPINTSH